MKSYLRKNIFRGLLLALALPINAQAAGITMVAGEACPSGYTHVTYQEATRNRGAYCSRLGQWSIARLANGGSMDGRGYQCKTRPNDGRRLGHSLCKKKPAVVNRVNASLNQAAYVNGTSEYRFGHNSIPNMRIHGAPADTGYGRFAMLHDGSTYRLYLFKRGSRDTLYQFGFNRATSRYEYGYNSIKVLKIVGMPGDANTNSFAMLHDGQDYRLYMRSRNGAKLYQAAYQPGSNRYVYGFRSIPSMNITGAPRDITNNKRWAMLHDGRDYRLYIGRRGNQNQFYQFAFNRATNNYEHGFRSIPTLTATRAPGNSKKNGFAMLHDGSAYRYYYKTR